MLRGRKMIPPVARPRGPHIRERTLHCGTGRRRCRQWQCGLWQVSYWCPSMAGLLRRPRLRPRPRQPLRPPRRRQWHRRRAGGGLRRSRHQRRTPRRRGLRYPLLLLLLIAGTLTHLTRWNDNNCDSGYGHQHSASCSEAGVTSPLRSAGRGVTRAVPLSRSVEAPSP